MRRNKRMQLPTQKKKRIRLRNAIRWALYLLLMLLAFLIANTGDYTKPLLLIPISLAIASVSGFSTCVGIGVASGFLMDMASGTLLGYHAIPMLLICIGISVLYDRLMQQRFLNYLVFTALAGFVITGLDFIFCYAIWNYAHVGYLYVHNFLPCLGYTVLSSAVFYPIFRLIHRHLLPPRKRRVEKTVKPIED